MNRHRNKKWLWALIIPIVIAGFTYAFMLLWNGLLPDIFGLKVITFWQSLGLLALSKLIFGGWRGGGRMRRQCGHRSMAHLNPEDRERYREMWKDRCRNRNTFAPEDAK